jgi:hypothetical protein
MGTTPQSGKGIKLVDLNVLLGNHVKGVEGGDQPEQDRDQRFDHISDISHEYVEACRHQGEPQHEYHL